MIIIYLNLMRQTIKQILQTAKNQIDNLDAELLLAYVIAKPREYVLSHPEKEVNFAKKYLFH